MREVKILKEQNVLLNNLTKMIENKLGIDNYLITEQDIANKYKVEVDEVISKVKEAIPLEFEDSSPKLRRAKILNNLYTKGLDYYKENEGGLKSNFTDAIIVRSGKMLFIKRSDDSKIEPGKWGLPGGHLESFLTPEKNVLKEIKEETGLDILEVKLLDTRNISNGMKIYYFLCFPTKEGEVVINNEEHSNYKWMSIEEIEKTSNEDFMFDLKEYILKLLNKK